ncbi:MAG: hypothetical protein AAGG72_08340, partial [Pseudomonadota bacterium]
MGSPGKTVDGGTVDQTKTGLDKQVPYPAPNEAATTASSRMTDMADTGEPVPPIGERIGPALASAGFWAVMVLGLCTPIVLFLTRQDLQAQALVLEPRVGLVAVVVAIVFVTRALWGVFGHT